MAVEAARAPFTLTASRNVSRKWPPSGCGARPSRRDHLVGGEVCLAISWRCHTGACPRYPAINACRSKRQMDPGDEHRDDKIGGHRIQPRFLRSRISPKICHSGLPTMPRRCWMAGTLRAQEGIGLELQVHARRQRRLAGRTQGIDLLGALLQGRIVGLDGEREAWRWPACTRGRNRPPSPSAGRSASSSDFHIIWASPSMTRPQPMANSVSPTKATPADGIQ